jgi:DNA-binding LytR/AlgR family response regulator
MDIHADINTAIQNENLPDQSNPFLYFRSDRKMIKIFLKDIVLIESLKDYIKVITENKTIITKQSISALEEMLPKDAFIRVHRSFIIAVNKIDAFNTDTIEIAKNEIPVGRLYKHDVIRQLNITPVKKGQKDTIVPGNNDVS